MHDAARVHIHIGKAMHSNVYFIDDNVKLQVDAGVKIGKKPDLLVITHCHFDHIQFIPDCEIAASAKCAQHLAKMDDAVIADKSPKKLKPIKANRILKDGDIIKTGRFAFTVMETPGHTDDSICLYEKKHHMLFSGDTMLDESVYGRTDLTSSDPAALSESIKRLKRLRIDVLYPGHE